MENELTLLVLAAGKSTRYDSLKQLEPVGPNDEFIMDYSIYNAIQIGIKKVILIISEENLGLFKNTIEKRIKKHIKVDYVFQKESLGTAHAIYCAKDKIKSDFVVINSDDLYNKEDFKCILNTNENSIIGYKLDKTFNNLPVKRGIIEIENDYLKEIKETEINKNNLNEFKDEYASMNMIKLSEYFFKYIEEYINQEKNEYQIPELLNQLIKENKIKIKVFKTNNKITGLTFKEDKQRLMNTIKNKIQKQEYPCKLWE